MLPKLIYEISKGSVKIHLDTFDKVMIFKDFIGYYIDFKSLHIQKIKYTGKEKIISPIEAIDAFVSHFDLKPLEKHIEEDKDYEHTRRIS